MENKLTADAFCLEVWLKTWWTCNMAVIVTASSEQPNVSGNKKE